MALVCAAVLDSIEAEIVQGRLASEGIQSFLFDIGLVGTNTSMGNVRVMVDESDYASVRRILREEGSI